NLDTTSIFRQIEFPELDSINKYKIPVNLISFTKAPLRYSFFGNLFKKKTVAGLSPILFDDENQIALVKLQVYSKKKQVAANPSKIIVLQKQADEWKILGIIPNKL
ncbi:MAG TPA: hypothetical protein VL095_04945, partial [Flavisolibacter sp.]|nr:hypothetical protein [Flavisolibacter sp.]